MTAVVVAAVLPQRRLLLLPPSLLLMLLLLLLLLLLDTAAVLVICWPCCYSYDGAVCRHTGRCRRYSSCCRIHSSPFMGSKQNMQRTLCQGSTMRAPAGKWLMILFLTECTEMGSLTE